MLKLLNNLLYEKNQEIVNVYHKEDYPIYFIIAQPRGASTLLQQLLISNLDIAYISNFLAKFYKSVFFGLELEKEVLDSNYKSNFLSLYGNTSNLNEPHEWGWFFKAQLGLEDSEHYSKKKSFESLKSNLLTIVNTKRKPLIIDNIYAMANILKFKKEFKSIRIINLSRDLYFICNSIINARLQRYDNIETFYGHPPENIQEVLKIQNPIEQIVFQVYSIQEEIDTIVSSFDKEHVINFDYEDIYKDCDSVVKKFSRFVSKENIQLKEKELHLPDLEYSNDIRLINPKYKEELDFYYEKYFGVRND